MATTALGTVAHVSSNCHGIFSLRLNFIERLIDEGKLLQVLATKGRVDIDTRNLQ